MACSLLDGFILCLMCLLLEFEAWNDHVSWIYFVWRGLQTCIYWYHYISIHKADIFYKFHLRKNIRFLFLSQKTLGKSYLFFPNIHLNQIIHVEDILMSRDKRRMTRCGHQAFMVTKNSAAYWLGSSSSGCAMMGTMGCREEVMVRLIVYWFLLFLFFLH